MPKWNYILWLLLVTAMPVFAQNGGYSLFRSFTVADGLPSNHIYNIVEDDHGFLWIATDAGIARFDGKEFQTFTVKDGLPDDEVLDVVKENLPPGKKGFGRIWVSCFKQRPAYFDEVKNRFINAKEDTCLAKVNGSRKLSLTAINGGGVMYWNENGNYFFRDGKLTLYNYGHNATILAPVIQIYDDGSYIAIGKTNFIYYIKGKVVDSFSLNNWIKQEQTGFSWDKNSLFSTNYYSAKYYVFTAFQTNPLRCKIDSVMVPEPNIWQRFTADYFYVFSKTDKIFVFNKFTLKLQFVINGNYSPGCLFSDSKRNVWVGSIDKGVFLYKKSGIETLAIPDKFTNTHFLSIARKPGGALLAGNYFGQVVETDGKYFIVNSLPTSDATQWQRKIIVSQNNIFTFGDGGSYLNYTKPLQDWRNYHRHSKTATYFNDSTIIEGFIDELSAINTKNELLTRLPGFAKRTTCIAVAAGHMIYHGSTDGLYKYDYDNQVNDSLSKYHPLLSERITAICVSPDNYVWVATASDGLLVLKNDSVVHIFSTANGIISNNIKTVTTGKPGKIWVGTNSGISIIKYSGNPRNFTCQNLTINDGLSSNIINEMLYSNDTIYCATGNGISAIPSDISIPRFDIPVHLTSVLINGRDTLLTGDYHLDHDQNNIQLQFAGIELGGHFRNFEYRINNSNWSALETGLLSLQLNSGDYDLEIRAIDVNGNVGTQPLLISFAIATPYWKALWFWFLLLVLAVGTVLFIYRHRVNYIRDVQLHELLNQKKITELELLALKSQINPHFIFNCLNSIKLLSHQHKHAEAEKYLDRFAALLRSAFDQSSLQQITLQQEIDFIENYLALEKLRMPDKLTYTVNAPGDINTAELLIPSMLLQPYVENAVKHGISPLKDRQGLVQVKFYREDGLLIAEVRDNGTGINIKTSETGHTGIGLENTARRSKLYHIETTVTDLQAVDPNSPGTLVLLKIPLQTKNVVS